MPFDIKKLIKEKPKTIPEVVAKAVAALESLEGKKEKHFEKAHEDVSKYLNYMKFWLFGDEGHDPTKENVLALANEVVKTEFLYFLVKRLPLFEFETRKDAAQVFGALVRIRDSEDRCIGSQHILERSIILGLLFDGYDDPNIALTCGSMVRDCVRDEAAAKLVLESNRFMDLFEKVEVANFEIASDAQSTFKDLLTRHKAVVAQYLSDHYNEFFDAYYELLQSPNYVTRRQSLKLLAEILLDRINVKVMIKYVSEVRNLMQMMNLLKDPSRSIQYEAFHVFKVFVANPNKPPAIASILINNRDKLLKYLEDFQSDRVEDEQFKEEKAVIIKEVSMMGQASGS